jgi:glyoxylase-like metal-dependent hydrolase (beta-lactamase superfamily II)
MKKIFIRLNGRGNAWPVYFGSISPFYNPQNALDLSNASYSIVCIDNNNSKIINEVLIDAGHGIVQFLVQNQNHLPNALVLTHPHIDHCLSTDWIAQSFYKLTGQKLPLYASKLCWKQVLKSFPQLEKTIDFKELKPGLSKTIDEFNNFEITFYPVFHGESAQGAGMILFKNPKSGDKALFTGDVLCPLLRKTDIEELNMCKVVYTDTNNRFAYPGSNHWSFMMNSEGKSENKFFNEWFNEKGKHISWLISPNLPKQSDAQIHSYFDKFIKEQSENPKLFFCISDFAKILNPGIVNLVHYSGNEDNNHHNQVIMDETQLKDWANQKAEEISLKTHFMVPGVGDVFDWTAI